MPLLFSCGYSDLYVFMQIETVSNDQIDACGPKPEG